MSRRNEKMATATCGPKLREKGAAIGSCLLQYLPQAPTSVGQWWRQEKNFS